MNKQIKFFLCTTIFCCGFIKPDITSAVTLDEELQRCSEIEVSLIRLQCYDRLAKGPGVTKKGPGVTQKASNQSKRRSLFQRRSRETTETIEEQNTATEVTRTDSSVATKSENINESSDNFGKVIESEADEISSRIIGQFNGWDGDTQFNLENGQVWKQSGNGILKVSMNNPKVTIEKGVFGGFNFSVEGYNSKVKVKRVK
jgi:hypothetical protein